MSPISTDLFSIFVPVRSWLCRYNVLGGIVIGQDSGLMFGVLLPCPMHAGLCLFSRLLDATEACPEGLRVDRARWGDALGIVWKQ